MSTPGPGLRRRVVVLFLSVLSFLAVLTGRVFWIQVVEGQELRAAAQETRIRHIPVEAKRGVIYDTRGRELAISISADTVIANPAEIDEPEATAAKLAPLLAMPQEEILKIITRRSAFEYVRRKIDQQLAQRVRALNLAGIYLTQETRRVYPKGMLAANVLGFAGMDSQGLNGVEVYYDEELGGKQGSIVIEYDARNREIPQAVHRYEAPEDGLSLQLTIDETIQHIAERELDKAMRETRARAAWVILMDPKDGGILALAQRPSFDPNKLMDYLLHGDPAGKQHADPKLWRNLAISDAYPPGSAFKPVTAAMALEEGTVTPRTPFYDPGVVPVPGGSVTNWDGGGLGSTDFGEGFEKSANTVFAQVGLRVGIPKFYEYINLLGLSSLTGIDLPGEGSGLLPPENQATPLDLALMAFGQTLTMTPIQVLTAMATIVNGGTLVTPHVAKVFLDKEGKVIKEIGAGKNRRVLSPQTSATIRELMGRVVENGTGIRAKIPGYFIGGKTGTSQKVIGGRVSTDRHIGSFIGVAPVEEPRVVGYIMVDEPQGMYYGGVVAAPVFQAIMRDVFQYLGVQPTRPLDAGYLEPWAISPEDLEFIASRKKEETIEVPDVLNLPLEAAITLLQNAGLTWQVEGKATQVVRQVPVAGAEVEKGTAVLLLTGIEDRDGARPGQVTVPDLKGRSLREAASILGSIHLRLEVIGSGFATEQYPQAGTILPRDVVVRVRFAPLLPDVEGQEGKGSPP